MARPINSPRGLFGHKYLQIGTVAAIPAVAVGLGAITVVINSTGKAALAINTTGTTWQYLNDTAVHPN